MDKTIATALFIIASVVATAALINVIMPATGKSSSALISANSAAAERIKTDIEIVFASGDTTNGEIVMWVKNVGTQIIRPIKDSDIFLTTPTSVARVPHTGSASANPRWDYIIENGTDWSQAVTLKVTLYMDNVSTGIHVITMAAYNSVSATKEFGV